MTAIGQYIVSVSAMALLSGIASALIPGGFNGRLIKVLCSLFLLITIAEPITGSLSIDLKDIVGKINIETERYVDEGKAISNNAYRRIIQEETEQYILNMFPTKDKIQIEVQLEAQGFMPECVIIKGDISKEEKVQLSARITQELGISEERQVWIE